MPPHGSPPAPSPAGPAASGPPRVPMWLVLGGAAVFAGAVGVAVDEPGPLGGRRLVQAPVRPIPHPRGPQHSMADLPPECGMSAAALDRVVPGRGDDEGERPGLPRRCSWTSDEDGTTFALSVDINPVQDPAGPVGLFLRQLPPAASGEAPLKAVVPLGDEAYARYSHLPERDEARIVMRAGNTVATVRFSGTRTEAGAAVPESRVMPPALQVVQEVARSLGAAATGEPKTTSPSADRPAVSARGPACAAVSRQVRRRVLGPKPAAPRKDTSSGTGFLRAAPVHAGARTDECHWSGRATGLGVETSTLADPAGAGAEAARTLEWLQWRVWKDGISRGAGGEATLFALAGRGEDAFAAYEPPSGAHRGSGLVAFRVHNAVILVTYAGRSAELPRDRAVDGAYTAAVEVAANFVPR